MDAHLLRVLVVEDNKDTAESLERLMRLAGYQVHVAYDGQTALQMAEQQRPHVVLLDIGLPVLHGYDVARRLRERPETKDTLIIAVTGYGLPADRERSLESGIDLHLIKPVGFEELVRLFRKHPKLAGLR
jgi:two-component system CheB/CheR fusion protein